MPASVARAADAPREARASDANALDVASEPRATLDARRDASDEEKMRVATTASAFRRATARLSATAGARQRRAMMAAKDVFRAMCVARHALRRSERESAEGESDAEAAAASAARANARDGKARGPARATRAPRDAGGVTRFDFKREVVPVCEDGGELEMSTTNLGADARGRRGRADAPARAPRPLIVWAHGMRGDLSNDDQEGLWNFWSREDLGTCAVARYNARGYGRSSDVRRSREARWDARASDMLEVAQRIRNDDGGAVVFAGASLGGATAIWATVLAHESGRDAPKAVVVVTPPTFYDERESRKKKLRKRVATGDVTAPANSTTPRRVFQASKRPIDPPPPPLANPNDSCAVEVLIGSAQSNLPEPERVREALENVPVLVLAWDCGDTTHPVSSAMTLKDLAPHAEVVVASTRGEAGDEDYDIVHHVREHWSACIMEFIQRSLRRGGADDEALA